MSDKKELKKKYKEMDQPMGLFQIKNLTNGKVFIGSSRHVQGSINSLVFQLKHGLYRHAELQGDYTRLGADQFALTVLDILPPKAEAGHDYSEDLKELEKMWLDTLQPYGDKGYHKKKA